MVAASRILSGDVTPFPANWQVHVEVLSGGTISKISTSIIKKIKVLPVQEDYAIFVMIADGICNLTQETELSSGYILNYKTEKSAEQFSQLKAEIEKTAKDLADYNVTIKFATIPPVLLSKISSHFGYIFNPPELENDILLINSFISSVNLSNGTRTLRWDTDIVKNHMKRRGTHQTLKKVTRFMYKKCMMEYIQMPI